jgi:hypothetical protein
LYLKIKCRKSKFEVENFQMQVQGKISGLCVFTGGACVRGKEKE